MHTAAQKPMYLSAVVINDNVCFINTSEGSFVHWEMVNCIFLVVRLPACALPHQLPSLSQGSLCRLNSSEADWMLFSWQPFLNQFLCLPLSYAPVVLTWEHHNWFRFSRFLLHINQEGTVQLILRKKYRHQALLHHRPSRDAEARDTTRHSSCYTNRNRGLPKNCCRFPVVLKHLLYQGFIGVRMQSFNQRLCLCPSAAGTGVFVG